MSTESAKRLATMIRGLADRIPELLRVADGYEDGLDGSIAVTISAHPLILGAVGGLMTALASIEGSMSLHSLGQHLIEGCILKTEQEAMKERLQ
jgi:hypothetical protein